MQSELGERLGESGALPDASSKNPKEMKYGNIDACWEALEKAVNGLNDGRGTLADIVKEFGLEEWRPGRYFEPRWGWPIEYDPEVGYYLCY